MSGGSGTYIAVYLAAATGVTVNLASATASDGDGGTDSLSGIEIVVGSNFDDVLTGAETRVTFSGELGDDTLNGAGGADLLKGDEGDDTLTGNGGVDSLVGGAGNDTYIFGDNVDVETITESAGSNDLSIALAAAAGDPDVDPASFKMSRQGDNLVSEDRSGDTGGDDFAVFVDDFFTTGTIERFVFNDVGATEFVFAGTAGAGNDLLILTDSDNSLSAGGGADIVYTGAVATTVDGGGGDDFLIGADGHDVLQGGDGDDRLFGAAGTIHSPAMAAGRTAMTGWKAAPVLTAWSAAVATTAISSAPTTALPTFQTPAAAPIFSSSAAMWIIRTAPIFPARRCNYSSRHSTASPIARRFPTTPPVDKSSILPSNRRMAAWPAMRSRLPG